MVSIFKKCFLNLLLFFFLIYLTTTNAQENKIIVKVGNEIITSLDLKNEIQINLLLGKREINQENIDSIKDFSIKNLITKIIKNREIKKYNIINYDQNRLDNYLNNLNQNLNDNTKNLALVFEENNLDYNAFKESIKNELRWNNLIFQIYKNQTSVNPQEVENDLNQIINKKDKSTSYEISEIQILNENFNEEKYLDISNFIRKEGFVNAVKEFSISASKSNKGKLGIFKTEELKPELLNLILSLKEGEFTKPYIDNDLVTIFNIDKIIKESVEVDIDKIRNEIIANKKEEKLRLFSQSHFSNLEISTVITFL